MFLWFPWLKSAKKFQNLFHTILNTSNNKRQPPKKEEKKPNAVKDRGGGSGFRGTFDRGQRFNGFFFKPSLSVTFLHCQLSHSTLSHCHTVTLHTVTL